MEELDLILNEFSLYKRIGGFSILDELLPQYLRNAELATPEGRPNQGREVARMICKDDLSSKSVIFHEKCEIGSYLDFGYTIEEIRDGTAYEKNYCRAHDIAERLELQLLQHVAKIISGKTIPLFSFVSSRPAMQLFDPSLNVVRSRIRNYLPNNTYFGLCQGLERFVPLEFKPDEVETIFDMFERFGSQYQIGIKQKMLAVVEDFVKRTNQEFRNPENYLWVKPKKNTTNFVWS